MAYNFNQPQPYSPQNNNYSQAAPPQTQPMMNQNVQPLFPQPQGNVYNINSTLEVANVPVGAGISVALCLPENTMFIKTMQNGNPLFYPYKIVPYSNEVEQSTSTTTQEANPIDDLITQIQSCNERISAVEEAIKSQKKKGVDFNL